MGFMDVQVEHFMKKVEAAPKGAEGVRFLTLNLGTKLVPKMVKIKVAPNDMNIKGLGKILNSALDEYETTKSIENQSKIRKELGYDDGMPHFPPSAKKDSSRGPAATPRAKASSRGPVTPRDKIKTAPRTRPSPTPGDRSMKDKILDILGWRPYVRRLDDDDTNE